MVTIQSDSNPQKPQSPKHQSNKCVSTKTGITVEQIINVGTAKIGCVRITVKYVIIAIDGCVTTVSNGGHSMTMMVTPAKNV
jgi:hypothetical protein